MPTFLTQKVEEFFNKNHSHQDGKFTSGGGGSSRAGAARSRAADRALGRTPGITQQVRAEKARLAGVAPARDAKSYSGFGRTFANTHADTPGSFKHFMKKNYPDVNAAGQLGEVGLKSRLFKGQGQKEEHTGATDKVNSGTHASLKALKGTAKASGVKVGRDGGVSVHGVPTQFKVAKIGGGKYTVSGVGTYREMGSNRTYKTQAAAKAHIAKRINSGDI